MSGATYESLFNKFRDNTVISRCEQYARWTLPYLMADIFEVSSSGRVVVERDYQEVGALFTNSLAAKLTRLLFPTQYPFFQASASRDFVEFAAKEGYKETELSSMFASMEMESNRRLFLNSGYASLILALKHLIVTGNALIYRDSEKRTIISYGIQSFAARRDGAGCLLDAVLREYTVVEALPESIQKSLKASSAAKYGRPEQTVKKYTRIHRQMNNGVEGYYVSQEVDTISVGDATWYPKDLCPWMAPTWVLIPGEHYGRGMVEDYAGGFARLSSLSEAGALYAVEIMRVVHLVGAAAGSSIDELAQSESGEWVRGDPNEVQAYEAGDDKKLIAVRQEIERVVMNLARAFMYEAVSRQAERVTAYELQRDAEEAELALGGVYSTISGGIQVPMAHILMTEVNDMTLAGLVTGNIRPDVTAGIPALGRSAEVQNFLTSMQEIGAVAPIIQTDKRINPAKVSDMIFSARSFDTKQVFYTEAEQKANDAATMATQNAQQSLVQADTLAASGNQITQLGG